MKMKPKITLLAFFLLVITLSFTSAFSVNIPQPTVTQEFYNQTVNATVNTTQFSSNSPITLNLTWLTSWISNTFDTVYCKLTGCTMTGSIANATSYGLYTAYTPTGLEPTGTTYYDNASHTVATVLEGGVIVQQGQELHVYGKNAGGVIIHNGDAVSITNVGGSFTTFGLTNGTDPVSAYAFVGLATQDIGVNDFGYVTSRGVVRDINTNSWTEGLPLYVNTSSPGHLTQTYPSAPNFIINVGVVEYKSINHGRINVVPVVVPRLQDLSDVDGYPLNSTGQFYVWNQTRKLFDSNFNINDYVLSTTANNSYLKLDQTTPQTVTGGKPIFGNGLNSSGNIDFSSGLDRVISVLAYPEYTGTANSLTIKGQDRSTYSSDDQVDGGSVTITTGAGGINTGGGPNGNGGDLFITTATSFNNAGYINIIPGFSQDAGTTVTITGGSGTTSGGNVDIDAGSGFTNGLINLGNTNALKTLIGNIMTVDRVNNRVQIGDETSSTNKLWVGGSAWPALVDFSVGRNGAVYGGWSSASATETASPIFLLSKAKGTMASPTAVTTGHYLGTIGWYGQYDSTLTHVAPGATISAIARGTFSSTSSPADLVIQTTPSGSTTPLDRLTILSGGNLGIGTTAPREKLEVVGNILMNDSYKALFGNDKDSSVYYDGTNFIINPKEVGSGQLKILGNTNITGNLNQINGNATINNFYGGMWMHIDSGLSGTFNSTYQKLAFFNSNNDNGFTFHSNTSLQLTNANGAGLYQAIYKLEGEGTNNHEYHSYVFINEVQQNNTIGHAIGEASDSVKMNGLGMIRINHNDNITVRLADLTASGTGTQIDANINLVRIGN